MKKPTYAEALEKLHKRVEKVLEPPTGKPPEAIRIERISVQFDDMTPLEWLRNRRPGKRIYWSGRDYGIEVAAVGEADCKYSGYYLGLKELRSQLTPALAGREQGIRYYGGIRFSLFDFPKPQWNSFGTWRFVLPRFEVQKHSRATVLTCNLVLPQDYMDADWILDEFYSLRRDNQTKKTTPQFIDRKFEPDFQEWGLAVGSALQRFKTTPIEKVVLAREASVNFSERLDPVSILQELKQITPNCFHFLFEPDEDGAFLGASPERLFRREGRSIESEAVAGTRPRGDSDVDDARMIDELYRSAKEQREHEFVRISLQEDLAPLAEYVTMDTQPSIMRLASERHLVSRLRAIIPQECTSLDILEALHPSPAVGGYPSDEAMDFIKEQESFDRGWYAGPVGWIGVNEAEFAVGIRSALVSGSTIRLYSGAGIVRGSVSRNEWNEVEHKTGDLAQVLGLTTEQV